MNVYCDNEECEYNDRQACTRHKIFYIKRKCRTFRRRQVVRAADLMRTNFKPGCRKVGGKYVSSSARVFS